MIQRRKQLALVEVLRWADETLIKTLWPQSSSYVWVCQSDKGNSLQNSEILWVGFLTIDLACLIEKYNYSWTWLPIPMDSAYPSCIIFPISHWSIYHQCLACLIYPIFATPLLLIETFNTIYALCKHKISRNMSIMYWITSLIM